MTDDIVSLLLNPNICKQVEELINIKLFVGCVKVNLFFILSYVIVNATKLLFKTLNKLLTL